MANFLIVMIANTDSVIQIAKALNQKTFFKRFGDFKIFDSYNWQNLPSEQCEKIAIAGNAFFAIIEKENSVLVYLHSFRHTHTPN